MFADFDAIRIGDVKQLTKRITAEDVAKFVAMTGDNNPLHVDPAFAGTTSFKDIVVHGMLGASFISTVIGTKLPGPGALWVSQNMEFLRPVRLGDELSVTCTVLKKHERDRLVELDTVISNQTGDRVLVGRAKVKVLTPKVEAARVSEPGPKTAIVTGGSGGIGEAICRRLAMEGFNVVLSYRSRRDRAEALAEEIGSGDTRAIAVQAEMGERAAAGRLVDAAVQEFGGISALINNAAPAINPKPFSTLEWSEIQAHIDAQVRGAFELAKACVPHMSAGGWGRIVNVTSQVIEGQPTVHWTSYAIGKAALAMMSRYLAAELGPGNITVNCVSPGMTETSLIGGVPEKVQMMIARQTPLRRLSRPDDVASAIAYLVSDNASFVTGHTLAVNGGMTMS